MSKKIEKSKNRKKVDFRKNRVFDFLDHFLKEINEKSKNWKNLENIFIRKFFVEKSKFSKWWFDKSGPPMNFYPKPTPRYSSKVSFLRVSAKSKHILLFFRPNVSKPLIFASPGLIFTAAFIYRAPYHFRTVQVPSLKVNCLEL